MEEKLRNKKNEMLKKMNLPREVLSGEPKITIIGREEVTIENHKGINKFEETEFILNTSIGVLNFKGVGFEIMFIEEETIVLKGEVKEMYYGAKRDE